MKMGNRQPHEQVKKAKSNPYAGSGWIYQGIIFAILLFVIMYILYPWITGDDITAKSLLVGAFSSMIGGLVYGAIMKWLYKSKMIKDK